jgi:hypothetical protein
VQEEKLGSCCFGKEILRTINLKSIESYLKTVFCMAATGADPRSGVKPAGPLAAKVSVKVFAVTIMFELKKLNSIHLCNFFHIKLLPF